MRAWAGSARNCTTVSPVRGTPEGKGVFLGVHAANTYKKQLDLRPGTRPPADGAQYVQAEIGGDNAQKDEDGGQNQAALFERKRDGQDATADDGGDQSERCRDDGGLPRRAVVLGIQDLNVRDVSIVRLGRRNRHGILLGEQWLAHGTT